MLVHVIGKEFCTGIQHAVHAVLIFIAGNMVRRIFQIILRNLIGCTSVGKYLRLAGLGVADHTEPVAAGPVAEPGRGIISIRHVLHGAVLIVIRPKRQKRHIHLVRLHNVDAQGIQIIALGFGQLPGHIGCPVIVLAPFCRIRRHGSRKEEQHKKQR